MNRSGHVFVLYYSHSTHDFHTKDLGIRYVGRSRTMGMSVSIPPMYLDACEWIGRKSLEKAVYPLYQGCKTDGTHMLTSYQLAWWTEPLAERFLNCFSDEKFFPAVEKDLADGGVISLGQISHYSISSDSSAILQSLQTER